MDVPEIDVAELAPLQRAGSPIIDVREDHEYRAAHVPGVRHIPLGEVVERIDEVPAAEPVFVICGSGGRSARAVQHYRQQGIDAINVAGGIKAWIEAGNPVEVPESGESGAGST